MHERAGAKAVKVSRERNSFVKPIGSDDAVRNEESDSPGPNHRLIRIFTAPRFSSPLNSRNENCGKLRELSEPSSAENGLNLAS
jgi:hypothetical protein